LVVLFFRGIVKFIWSLSSLILLLLWLSSRTVSTLLTILTCWSFLDEITSILLLPIKLLSVIISILLVLTPPLYFSSSTSLSTIMLFEILLLLCVIYQRSIQTMFWDILLYLHISQTCFKDILF
jgi:hypothetical protein